PWRSHPGGLRDRRDQGSDRISLAARGLQAGARALLQRARRVLHRARAALLPHAHGHPLRRADPHHLPFRALGGVLAMTLGMPIAVWTVLAVAGGLGALAVVAYILKMRRRRFEVPFSTLWQRVLLVRVNTTLLRHLRRLLSLRLQLLLL